MSKNIIEEAVDWVENQFKKIPPAEQSIVKIADAITNGLKALEANSTVQFLQTGLIEIAEAVDPAITPLINGLELEIPKILNALTFVEGELSKPDSEQVNDALAKIAALKIAKPKLYANVETGINVGIQDFLSSNNGRDVTAPQLLANAVAVHAGTV